MEAVKIVAVLIPVGMVVLALVYSVREVARLKVKLHWARGAAQDLAMLLGDAERLLDRTTPVMQRMKDRVGDMNDNEGKPLTVGTLIVANIPDQQTRLSVQKYILDGPREVEKVSHWKNKTNEYIAKYSRWIGQDGKGEQK